MDKFECWFLDTKKKTFKAKLTHYRNLGNARTYVSSKCSSKPSFISIWYFLGDCEHFQKELCTSHVHDGVALRSSLWLSNSSIKTFLPQPEANTGELGSMVNVYTTRTHGKLQVLTRKSNYSGGMLIIITCPD